MSITIDNKYYNTSNRLDYIINSPVIYAVNSALQLYLTKVFFPDDPSRVIYSTTDYAFRKRASSSPWNNLMLPFINYREIDISADNDRSWKSFPLETKGIYIPEIGEKVRLTPIKIDYESTVFFDTDRDNQEALLDTMFEDANETPLDIEIKMNGVDIQLYGSLSYNFSYKSGYNEDDWLINNKISSMSLNMSIQTVIPKISRNVSWGLTDTIILNMGKLLCDDTKTIEETYKAIVDHFNETTSDFEKQ